MTNRISRLYVRQMKLDTEAEEIKHMLAERIRTLPDSDGKEIDWSAARMQTVSSRDWVHNGCPEHNITRVSYEKMIKAIEKCPSGELEQAIDRIKSNELLKIDITGGGQHYASPFLQPAAVSAFINMMEELNKKEGE